MDIILCLIGLYVTTTTTIVRCSTENMNNQSQIYELLNLLKRDVKPLFSSDSDVYMEIFD